MGNLANTSAQVIEIKHLFIKSDAARTNNKTNWELQLLIKQQRRDHAMEQSWQPKDADDDKDDTEALWVPKCKPRARASFGHSMYSTLSAAVPRVQSRQPAFSMCAQAGSASHATELPVPIEYHHHHSGKCRVSMILSRLC